MDWENERYVRLFVRNTTTWRRLGWDGQCVLMHLLRVVDRSGVLDVQDMEPAEAVALHTGAPADVAQRATAELLRLGCLVLGNNCLMFPNFIVAQECTMSDKLRAKLSRERRASQSVTAPSQNVTESHAGSHAVTPRHAASHDVTPSVLCSAEPSDPTVLSLPCSAVQSARARDVADAVLPSASRGRARLREVDGGLLDFDHHGRWQTALTTIAAYPAAEWAIAATTLAQVAQDPERRGFLTPQHIVDYWATYSAGDTPGPKGADWKERAQKTAAVRKLRVDDQLRAFRAETDVICTALKVSDFKLAEETRMQREREYSALYKQLHGETS